MIVIRLDEELTPEVKQAIIELIGRFNVIGFGEESESRDTGPVVRSGQTGQDLSAAVSQAVDKVKHAKPTS